MKKKTADHKLIKAFSVILPKNVIDRYSAQDFVDLQVGDKPLFQPTPECLHAIFDLGFLIKQKGVVETYNYLHDEVIPQLEDLDVEQNEFYSYIVFSSPLLERQKMIENITLSLNDDKGPLTDLVQCPRCDAPKVSHKKMQTRSIDEGATSIFTCVVCKWTLTES